MEIKLITVKSVIGPITYFCFDCVMDSNISNSH